MKLIVILVGPKGSGKSHIGSVVASLEEDVCFCSVELLWKSLPCPATLKDYILSGTIDSDVASYFKRGNALVLQEMKKLSLSYSAIVMESVGGETLALLLEELESQTNFKVILIRVEAPLSLCLKRVQERNQSLHIAMNVELVERVNRKSLAEADRFHYALTIENANHVSDHALANLVLQEIKTARHPEHATA